MAVAEVLTGIKDQLPGSVKFIFQPAEEGPSLYPPGSGKLGRQADDEGRRIRKDQTRRGFRSACLARKSGEIAYRTGAAGQQRRLRIKVTGKQGHGGIPWHTMDPITTSAQIVVGLQTVVSRKADLTGSPAVVTIGTINGGSRANIVPETVEMTGTIRTYDEASASKCIATSTGGGEHCEQRERDGGGPVYRTL